MGHEFDIILNILLPYLLWNTLRTFRRNYISSCFGKYSNFDSNQYKRINLFQKETDINELKRTNLSHHRRDLGTQVFGLGTDH